MGRGRPKAKLVVSPSERATLERWTMRHKTAQALACRARIVLLSARGMTNNAVAEKLDVSRQMVCKWRARFVEKRLDGILDEPRPGRPRKVGDAEIERVIVRTLESTPRDATHWSVRSMAKATGITPTTIHRIWRAFSLQPHRTETFKLSKDPLFIEKVRDIVGLYLNPPEKAAVLCVDEKSQVQALDRTQPLLPMRPGQAERRTSAGGHGLEGDRAGRLWSADVAPTAAPTLPELESCGALYLPGLWNKNSRANAWFSTIPVARSR
jgi:transposase